MNESKALQLLLKRGRENAEGHGGPLLTPPCGEQSRDDQALLESRQQIPKYEALARRLEVEHRPFREVTRHARQDPRRDARPQWNRGGFRDDFGFVDGRCAEA